MTASERHEYGALVIEQRDGVRTLTVQARQRGAVRPRRAIRLGCERHGIDTEVALLDPGEARALARLLLAVAGEEGTPTGQRPVGNPEEEADAGGG